MAENTKNVEFKNPHSELPVREPILKLGKMITDRAAIKLGLEKLTADDPEYWGLAAICTDEMAEVALKMGVRKPKEKARTCIDIDGYHSKEVGKFQRKTCKRPSLFSDKMAGSKYT